MGNFIYIISVSLQLSGAVLLMVFSLSTRRNQTLKRFASNSLIVRNSKMEIEYSKEDFRKEFKTAYLSKFSFAYIALGYLLGIYGEPSCDDRLVITIAVIAITLVLMAITLLVTHILLNTLKKVSREITSDELEKSGIEPDLVYMSAEEFNKSMG